METDTSSHRHEEQQQSGYTNGAAPSVDEAQEHASLCPPEVWIGPWGLIADEIGIHDWRVWTGVTAALSARAHRNLHCSYYGPLYGMGYYLLVAPSAHGKGLVTRLCQALVGSRYRVDTSVESGQALVELLADIERDDAGKPTRVTSVPSLLMPSEWSMLLQNMAFRGSSLQERLCEIADAGKQIDLTRVAKKDGGRIVVPGPSLTMCATTTTKNYTKLVNESLVSSGFINRHLILPGQLTKWQYRGAPGENIDYDALTEWADDRYTQPHTFGLGRSIIDCYAPDSLAVDDAFGESFLEPIHNAPDDNDAFTRLHVYNRRLAALYAWADFDDLIRLPHVLAANAVTRASFRFLAALHGNLPLDLPPTLRAAADLEHRILDMVRQKQPIRRGDVCNALRRHGGYIKVSEIVDRLVKSRVLDQDNSTKKCLLKLAPQDAS